MKMKTLTFWLLSGALLLAMPASAEIYKWKDKNGVIRYSDTPPQGNVKQEAYGTKKPKPAATSAQPAPAVKPVETVPNSVSAGGEPVTDPEEAAADQRRRNAEAEKAKKEEQEKQAKLKEENCRAAKNNLATYKQGGRIYTTNEKGEREYQSDNDLKVGTEKAQAEVNEYCS